MNFSGSNFWARGRHPAYLLSRKTEHTFLELLEIFKPGRSRIMISSISKLMSVEFVLFLCFLS